MSTPLGVFNMRYLQHQRLSYLNHFGLKKAKDFGLKQGKVLCTTIYLKTVRVTLGDKHRNLHEQEEYNLGVLNILNDYISLIARNVQFILIFMICSFLF